MRPGQNRLEHLYDKEVFCANCGEENTIPVEQAVIDGERQQDISGFVICECGWALVYKQEDPDAVKGTSSVRAYQFQ